MFMNMKHSDCMEKLQILWEIKKVVVFTVFKEVLPIAAIDVVVMADAFASITLAYGLNKAVVHVHVSDVSRW